MAIPVDLDLNSNAQITIDKELFETVLLNLIDNAFQYSMPDPKVLIKTSNQNQHIQIEVRDNGSGIASEEKKNIFDKFYRIGNEETRKTKGTGLGLYLSAEIMKMHNGKISVADNKPNGSIFSLLIPRHE